jgi:hypothetical protein
VCSVAWLHPPHPVRCRAEPLRPPRAWSASPRRADKFVRTRATPAGLLDALNEDIKAYGFALALERREVDGVVCVALVNTREDAAMAENKAHNAAFFQLFNAILIELMTECVRRARARLGACCSSRCLSARLRCGERARASADPAAAHCRASVVLLRHRRCRSGAKDVREVAELRPPGVRLSAR